MGQKIVKSYKIRRKMLLTMTMLLLSLTSIMAYKQVVAQRETIERETGLRLALIKRDLIQRAYAISEALTLQVENGIATSDMPFVKELLNTMVEEASELTYAILMDKDRKAAVHTLQKELEGQTLSGPEDLYAAELDEPGTNEYKRDGELFLEFVLPIKQDENPWGVLRLGFSMQRVNDIIAESERAMDEQTIDIIVSSSKLALMAVAVSIVLFYIVVIRSIKRIETLQETMQLIQSDSDLSKRIEVVSEDEIGMAANAFNTMLGNFQVIIREMATSADHLTSATTTLFSTTERNAAQAKKHSLDVNSMTSNIEKTHNAIADVTQNTAALSATSETTRQCAMDGGEVISRSVKTIERLSEYSSRIDGITQAIQSIANITDILAINTAIEAAKAGHHGQGFRVVAKEVKKLAEQTTQSTVEISNMVSDIQKLTANAVETMEESSQAMETIINQATKVDRMVDEIVKSARIQSEIAQKMLASVHSVHKLSKGFSMDADKTKRVAAEINNQSLKLYQVVERFRT